MFDFFVEAGLGFGVHAALPSLRYPAVTRWALSAQAHGELLERLLDRYLAKVDRVRISTLDSMIRSVSAGRGGICTFTDCLGEYLAVGPDGSIYPCQRFAGMPDFVLGNVTEQPTLAELAGTPVWQAFQARQDAIDQECGGCTFLALCRGGCPYNALTAGNLGGRDSHCEAYRRTFTRITDKALDEVFAPANLDAVVNKPDASAGLLRTGTLLSIMRDGPHPATVASNARQVLATVALAATGDPAEAARRLHTAGAVSNVARATGTITALRTRLNRPPARNNLYLHVTFACNLRCTHCYAAAQPTRRDTMSVPDAENACVQAAAAGFAKTVITGGEPLVHPQRELLLNTLARLRGQVKPMNTSLRTSLAVRLTPTLTGLLSHATDQVVVSIDGDQATHDARRGAGSYQQTVTNLHTLTATDHSTDISLACVLPAADINGPAGDSVRALAKDLDITRIRFRPLLPLGRAAHTMPDLAPEPIGGHQDPANQIGGGLTPTRTCGLGQNLYVQPDGTAYPCYAITGHAWNLGSITDPDGLHHILASHPFQDLAAHTVDTNQACRHCPLRYLCGGACKAWNPPATRHNLDDPPADCNPRHHRALNLLTTALTTLHIEPDQWLAADLPLPTTPSGTP